MEKIAAYKHSAKAHVATVGGLFLLMLLFNILTKRYADDYMYAFHCATGDRLEHAWEIYESMVAHGEGVNGRYFAHTFAQFFLLLPDIIFDIVNSAVFVFTVYAVYRIANSKNKTNNLFFLAIFGCLWLFEFDFGQINFWLDGACNYLFGVFWGLLYIIPFLQSVMHEKKLHPLLILPHMAASFLLGGYLEPLTVGFGCMAGLLLIADLFYFKNKSAWRLLPSLLASAAGLYLMVSAPGEHTNKLAVLRLANLVETVGLTLLVAVCLLPLAWVFFALRKRARKEAVDRRILVAADILAIGAIVSDLIMLIAQHYPLRCSVACVFLSVFSVALLYGNVSNRNFGCKAKLVYKIFALAMAVTMTLAIIDHTVTFAILENNEHILTEAAQNGEKQVEVYVPLPITKYNGLRGLKYLDTQEPTAWPNNYVAAYYELELVRGKSLIQFFR